jgi:hypothetical protein
VQRRKSESRDCVRFDVVALEQQIDGREIGASCGLVQGRLAGPRLLVEADSRDRQQQLHDRRVALARSEMQRRDSVVVGAVRVAQPEVKPANKRNVTAERGVVEWRPSGSRGTVEIEIPSAEKCRQKCVTFGIARRRVQHCPAVGVFDVRIDIRERQKELDNCDVAALNSEMQRRHPGVVDSVDRIDIAGNEKLRNLEAAELAGEVQSSRGRRTTGEAEKGSHERL